VVIFGDDPDATEKLVDKIERLKKRQGVMRRVNQLIRKADREGLADSADPKQKRERFQQLTQNPKVQKSVKCFPPMYEKAGSTQRSKNSPLGARPIGYLSPKLSLSWGNIIFISLSPRYEAGRKGAGPPTHILPGSL
jgi:hypothetical protein